MKRQHLIRLLPIFLASSLFFSFISEEKSHALYTSLDPKSISQHIAYLKLYPETIAAQKAEETLAQLLGANPEEIEISPDELRGAFNAFYEAISARGSGATLSSKSVAAIEKIGRNLPHKKLRGHRATSEKEVLELRPDEIDLARGLLLSELGSENLDKIRSIEAMCDLMAIQVALRLNPNATIEEKVSALNQFIFFEMGFRFPPHSAYVKDIDLYTFLPSVLDGRRGVCLGISILYICLAQRLDLPLEMITPPGHIYIRAPLTKGHINIETTARGIDLPDEIYLSMECKALPVRNIKEVIGMAHFNRASLYWLKEPEKAVLAYQKTLDYIPDDPLTEELMGYCYFLLKDSDAGRFFLNKAKSHPPTHLISSHGFSEDLLSDCCDSEGLFICFMEVDETRASLLKKREALQNYLKKKPCFASGWQFLAICQLQLLRQKEAIEALEQAAALAPIDAETAYYLSSLYKERRDFEKAWRYLKIAQEICQRENHNPKALWELELTLKEEYPFQ